LDQDNQLINPTKAVKRSRSQGLNKDLQVEQKPDPPTTKKHDAMVAKTRALQTKKMAQKVEVGNEDHVRAIK